MGIFSKKEKYEFIVTSRYFIIGDDLYKFEVRDFMPDSDLNSPNNRVAE